MHSCWCCINSKTITQCNATIGQFFLISTVTGSLCTSAQDALGFVDALSAISTAAGKWSSTKWGEWLHLLSAAPSFITSSQPHLFVSLPFTYFPALLCRPIRPKWHMHLAELCPLRPCSCHTIGHGNGAAPQKQTSLQLDPFKNACNDATNAVMYAHVEFISSAHVMSGGAGCSDRFLCIGLDFKLRLLRVCRRGWGLQVDAG